MNPVTRRRDTGTDAVDQVLFQTRLVTIGSFRAGVDDPKFEDSGPIQRAIFVFPRTSVLIRHHDKPAFATDTCTVTYYNAGQRYSRAPIDPRGDWCEWFAVRPDVLVDILSSYEPGVAEHPAEPFPRPFGPSDADTYAAQRTVIRHIQALDPPDGLAVEESVVAILGSLMTLACGEQGVSRRDGRVSAAKRFLVDHFADPVTLEDVASAVDCSVFHLCRLFRDHTGTSIHRHRNRLRLRRSLELVAEPSSDLSAVAFQLGFSSHSHFTAAFRREFGTTPSEFREAPSSRRIRELTSRLG